MFLKHWKNKKTETQQKRVQVSDILKYFVSREANATIRCPTCNMLIRTPPSWFHLSITCRTRPSDLATRLPVNDTSGVEQRHFSYTSQEKSCFLVSHCILALFMTFGCWLFWTDLFDCQSSVTCDLGWRVSSLQTLPLLIPPIVKICSSKSCCHF